MNMSGESLLIILIIGVVAGWLAGQLVRGAGFGLIGDLIIGIIGASGLATLTSRRIKTLTPESSDYIILAKSIIILVFAGLFPVIGWFMLFPLQLFASLGAGFLAILRPSKAVLASSQSYDLR